MRTRIRDKECGISNGINTHHTHPGRVWGILHVIKYHHWRHVKRRLTQKRQGVERHDIRDEIPGTFDDSGIDNMGVHFKPDITASDVEETLANSTPQAKYSIKSKIKALLHEDTFKKKGSSSSRHKRSSTCPTKSQLTRVDSVHRLEVDPLSEMLLTVESPEPVLETFQNHLAASTLDVLSPVFSGKHVNTNSNKCVDCGTLFSSEALEHDKIHKHQKNLSNSLGDLSEEKLFNAKILTTDASPHLFKDFLDALDVINTNKDFLLKYINDPGSPLAFHTQNQHSPSSKSRRTKSISLPVSGSTSGTKDSETGQHINQIVNELFNIKVDNRESQIQSHLQNVSISPSSSNRFDQEWLERDYNFSSASPQTPTPNRVKTNNFKDLRKKLKHIIEESKNEKRRITMDAILDKIPRGSRLSKNVKKLIHDQSKDPTNGEGKDSVTSGYGSNLSSFYSFNKGQLSSMRTTSLRESADRYSQLYQTCFNSEVKYPKTENLKLKTEDKSSFLNTSKSIKRVLSMPNLKSYFHQAEELLNILSPQNSIRKLGDKTTRTSVTDESKSQIMSPTFADNTNQETNLDAEQKEVLVRSDSESGSDGKDEKKEDKSIGIDGLGNLREREIEGASCNEHELGSATESSTMLAEANSAFSSDTSFLDATFELENINVLEESDSELKSRPAEDGLDNNMEEKQEAKVDQSEVVENIENFQNFGTLTNHFNYEIPWIDVDESNEAAFNYVRKVLQLSGFTNHESLGLWYSDDQPVDPSVYEELEGCLLLDPDCSGNCDEGGQCNHLLLFDIINEGLLEIFGRSYNYYPRPLSSLSHVNPLQPGDNVLHKVWKLISWYLSSNSEAYPSLDYYVSKDLAKCDGWMNLQFDSECVGLELDDLIFDDLLEELICS